MESLYTLPPQQLSFSKKNKEWRKKHLDWADKNSYVNNSHVRNTIRHKKINYDLLCGKLNMEDLALVLNPEGIKASYLPNKIVHYPIINSKLNILRGEEIKRPFKPTVIVSNPNAISEIENQKKNLLLEQLSQIIENSSQSEEEANKAIEDLHNHFTYEYQDLREIRGNELLKHYSKELGFDLIFNEGFMDAITVGEEIYQCDIISGEPSLIRLDPLKVKVFKSGFSSKIEDADIITIEDYWSPGKIIDTFYEELTPKDIKYIESLIHSPSEEDPTKGFINITNEEGLLETTDLFTPSHSEDPLSPYDSLGNIRVLRVYWKSRRKVKKVKSYDPITGEEVYNIYPETYKANEALGEEETILYINEAWEGTKIGEELYVNMRPRPIQYNSISNPSKCHFGIIGDIYNLNNNKPFSLVDMMKHYNYLYDVTHDKLIKMLNKNWGKIITLDLAKVPEDWDVNKWLHYAKITGLAVVNSFKEGNSGAALGKIAGSLNNNTTGVIDAELGNSIQSLIHILEYIKNEMSEAVGISKQREGQISNRETVGGVERATLQSSHITEWLFKKHESIKERVCSCFLDTAKIALKGRNLKFQYILSDNSRKILEIDGDEFSEMDYGIVVESSSDIAETSQKLDMLAQAALQNQALNFSSIMQLYSSASVSEKQNIIRRAEQDMQRRQEEAQRQQQEQFQAQLQQQQKQFEETQNFEKYKFDKEQEVKLAISDAQNVNKLMIANSQQDSMLRNSYMQGVFRTDDDAFSEEERLELHRKNLEHRDKMKLEYDKLNFEKDKFKKELAVKNKSSK